jgi:large subunit ribosomal protein L7/L12
MEERLALINRRLGMLEQQVRVLSEALGVPCPAFTSDAGATVQVPGGGAVPAEVASLARSGNAIAAIKLLREITGADLREAKAIVDSLR